jgi:hypothetical protein
MSDIVDVDLALTPFVARQTSTCPFADDAFGFKFSNLVRLCSLE